MEGLQQIIQKVLFQILQNLMDTMKKILKNKIRNY